MVDIPICMWTIEELERLPDADNGGFGMREEVIDGKLRRVPFLNTVGALFIGDDDVTFEDSHGVSWWTGSANGVRYKRRTPYFGTGA